MGIRAGSVTVAAAVVSWRAAPFVPVTVRLVIIRLHPETLGMDRDADTANDESIFIDESVCIALAEVNKRLYAGIFSNSGLHIRDHSGCLFRVRRENEHSGFD